MSPVRHAGAPGRDARRAEALIFNEPGAARGRTRPWHLSATDTSAASGLRHGAPRGPRVWDKMARSSKGVEAALAQLNTLRADSNSPESIAQLSKSLDDRSNLVAARAAEIVREAKLEALLPRVAAMLRRFMIDPVKTDPGCAAKQAAAQAL